MFKINVNDIQSVIMDAESQTMSMLADFRSSTDNAYININSSASTNSFNNGVALGTSNLSDGSVVFGIAPYNSNISTAYSTFNIHNSNVGINTFMPQYDLDVNGDKELQKKMTRFLT